MMTTLCMKVKCKNVILFNSNRTVAKTATITLKYGNWVRIWLFRRWKPSSQSRGGLGWAGEESHGFINTLHTHKPTLMLRKIYQISETLLWPCGPECCLYQSRQFITSVPTESSDSANVDDFIQTVGVCLLSFEQKTEICVWWEVMAGCC